MLVLCLKARNKKFLLEEKMPFPVEKCGQVTRNSFCTIWEKKLQYLLLLSAVIFSMTSVSAQWKRSDLNVLYKYEELEHIFQYDNDTTYLINFWATWCGPCVKEMPYFQELAEFYEGKPFKLILVSLDFEKHIDTRLITFLNKHN